MKLSFSTLGCPDWTLARVIDVAGRLGYDGIELRFLEGDDTLWTRPELMPSGLPETRARLTDAGLRVACVDSRSFFHHADPGARATALEEARRVADVAAALGAPGIRVFGDRVQKGADLDSTRGWVAQSVAALRDHAWPAWVEVWLETHGDFATGVAARSVLDLAGGSGLGVIWDPANAFSEFGEDPEAGARALGNTVRHVHVKDMKRPAKPAKPLPWTPVLPGRGEFPAERVMAHLADTGYERFVSFEWEKKWHPQIEEPEIALPHFVRWATDRERIGEPKSTAPRSIRRGRLAVEVHKDRPEVGAAAARLVAAHVKRLIDRDGKAAVIFASAPSQNEFLAALREDRTIEWPKVTAFHLDEYVGVAATHAASFRRFVKDRLFDRVPVAAFHGLDGQAKDLKGECARYAALLEEHSPGLAILGIGENGHLAFIDPPLCDFQDPAMVRVVELDEACRNQQVHDGSFATIEEVPRAGLSLTIPYLLSVPLAVAIVPGPAKKAAVAAALDGPVSRTCPASILRRHPRATLFLDLASAAGVSESASS
jgi:glucosamine-6-phosphate deaminase